MTYIQIIDNEVRLCRRVLLTVLRLKNGLVKTVFKRTMIILAIFHNNRTKCLLYAANGFKI